MKKPKLVFQTIAGGSDKTHEGDAEIDLQCLLDMGVVPTEDYGGFNGDNPSLGEGSAVCQLKGKFQASGRALLGDSEWQEKDRRAVQEPTRYERSLEAIKSITPEDRVLAVAMEDKVAGQVGATKVFWAYLKRPDLKDSFKKHMPLAYGFAKRSFERTMVRDASKKPKKANLDEVLFSVKGIRDVFFTPRLSRHGDSTHIKVPVLGSRVSISGSYCERCKKVIPVVYYAS